MTMSREEALSLLQSGRSDVWNAYRVEDPDWTPDLSGFDLQNVNLLPSGRPDFDLSGALLFGTRFSPYEAYLKSANRAVNLQGAQYDIETRFPSTLLPNSLGAKFATKHAIAVSRDAERVFVFISYARQDGEIVAAIDQWLREKKVNMQIDRREFFAGSQLDEEIDRVMRPCSVVLFIYSANAQDRPWIEFERRLAATLGHEAKESGREAPRIMYVAIDSTPLPPDPEPTVNHRLSVRASGRLFPEVCEEIYSSIMQIPRSAKRVLRLAEWSNYRFR